MKTKNWLWLLIAVFGWSFYACSDDSPSTPPEWAVNGGSINLTPSDHELSRDEAWELVKEIVLVNNLKDIAVRSYKDIIPANDSIQLGFNVKIPTPQYRSWFFFIEENYDGIEFIGAHNCRYVFVSIDGSTIEVQFRSSGTAPKHLGEYDDIVKSNISSEIKNTRISSSRSTTSIIKNEISAAHNYAIIINGGGNKEENYICFWNSCSTIYNRLIQQYGYLKSNIKVLMTDGGDPSADRKTSSSKTFDSSPTDFDGDGISDITSSATAYDVQMAFADLASTLTSEDELIVFINDHGGVDNNNNCATLLWGDEYLFDFTLNYYLNQIVAKNIHIIISACHSGGFVDTLAASNRTITTACSIDERLSFNWNNSYDNFLLYWLSAIMAYSIPDNTSINSDANHDGIISYKEAYNYSYVKALQHSGIHVQYSSTPTTLGDTRGLAPEKLYSINGDSYFCNQEIYNIPNLPTGASVTWNVVLSERNPNSTSELAQSSFTSNGTTLTLNRTAPATYTIGATITYNGLQETISKTASCGTCSPYNGKISWESNLLNGDNQFNYNTGRPEFELDVPQDFVITSYVDFAGNIMIPTIDYIMSPDITQDDCSGNTATLTFGFSGEGDMELYLLNGCNNYGELYPFTIPYIVFDPNSYSLLLNKNNSTLNIASQTTTYGLRNENPIRTVEVRTYDRQTLLSFNLEDEQTNVADIDISSLAPGTYVLKVTDDSVHYLKLVI